MFRQQARTFLLLCRKFGRNGAATLDVGSWHATLHSGDTADLNFRLLTVPIPLPRGLGRVTAAVLRQPAELSVLYAKDLQQMPMPIPTHCWFCRRCRSQQCCHRVLLLPVQHHRHCRHYQYRRHFFLDYRCRHSSSRSPHRSEKVGRASVSSTPKQYQPTTTHMSA